MKMLGNSAPTVGSANTRRKMLFLGCALTGAKYTPLNHRNTGDSVLDSICRGDAIPTTFAHIQREATKLYHGGCRYFHVHARNPQTREQSCDNFIYAEYNQCFLSLGSDVILSYGASRNGTEIDQTIKRAGEWARVSQGGLSLDSGGAHFVTVQAAVELQIVRDLEKQNFIACDEEKGTFEIKRSLERYNPSRDIGDLALPVYSTSGGKNYGQSSARMQYATLQRAIRARHVLGLSQEVEWVQFARSHAMTYLASKHMQPGLMGTGRLNITVLFGFAPKLPFPTRYEQFRHVIRTARSLGTVGYPVRLTVTVGSAVLPQHAAKLLAPLDVGPLAGQVVSPLDRLVAYASQPDSDVDMMRFGMEDTPYLIDAGGALRVTSNVELMEVVLDQLRKNGAEVVIESAKVRAFATSNSSAPIPLAQGGMRWPEPAAAPRVADQ